MLPNGVFFWNGDESHGISIRKTSPIKNKSRIIIPIMSRVNKPDYPFICVHLSDIYRGAPLNIPFIDPKKVIFLTKCWCFNSHVAESKGATPPPHVLVQEITGFMKGVRQPPSYFLNKPLTRPAISWKHGPCLQGVILWRQPKLHAVIFRGGKNPSNSP